VTGQVAVAIDFFPGKPARFVGLDKHYPEIPTVPSMTTELTKTIQELPIRDLFFRLDSAVTAIDSLVSSDAARTSVKSLNRALGQATTLMKSIDARVGPLVASLQGTSDTIKLAAGKVSESLSGEAGAPAQFRATLEVARKTLERAEQALSSVQDIAQQNSAMGHELGDALSEMHRSLRSLRVMSDYLERHPEALLTGKKGK
jgi:paraquat-inducible protein B